MVRREAEIAWIDLGEEATVRDVAGDWRAAIAVGDAAQERIRSRLASLLVEPLNGVAEEVKEWYVLLDGELPGIPLESLPYRDGCLGDHHRILVLLDPRGLWVQPLPSVKGTALVAFGDVAYGDRRSTEGVGSATGGAVPDQGTTFLPLPQSGAEIDEIAQVFEAARGEGAPVRLFDGPHASRTTLERVGPRARYLHLATHAYFAPFDVPQRADQGPLDVKLRFGTRSSLPEEIGSLSPLTLCGIALAGANLTPEPAERLEGRMTGEEIAAVDLSGCELVVRSSSGGAQGIPVGPVIASVQTAFHAAGARSVLTALWALPDDAIGAFMTAFYRYLWIDRLSKTEAQWRAKCALRDSRNADGSAKYTLRDWAGWILTGDPH